MRGGYLRTLAARTLGAAPLLRPATPSRFEPDGLHGSATFGEIEQSRPPTASMPPPAPSTEAQPPPEAAGGQPPPGHQPRPDPEAPLLPAAWEPTVAAELSGRTIPPPQAPMPHALEEPGAVVASPASPARAQALTTHHRPDAPTDIEAMARQAAPAPGSARHGEPEPGQPSRGARNGPAVRSREAGAGTEPPIVVRIGRIDVRAVQAPPPPPAPRPQPAAGPSLADYLLARDRGRP